MPGLLRHRPPKADVVDAVQLPHRLRLPLPETVLRDRLKLQPR
jgi:hypothetical protein